MAARVQILQVCRARYDPASLRAVRAAGVGHHEPGPRLPARIEIRQRQCKNSRNSHRRPA